MLKIPRFASSAAPALRLAASAVVLAMLAACSGASKPKPAELPSNPALFGVRQAWSLRIPAVTFPLQTDVSGDTHIDVIKALQLMSMTILADEHGGADPFAVLEYALDPDAEDDVLLVNLASDGHVQSVTSAD